MDTISTENVVMIGDGGYFDGEEYVLTPGKVYTVGRSSLCDISMKNTRRFQMLEEEGLLLDESFRHTSRKHFTVAVYDSGQYAETATDLRVRVSGSVKVVIKCLSDNGVSVNGKRFTELIIPDIGYEPHIVEFGSSEKFKIFVRKLP